MWQSRHYFPQLLLPLTSCSSRVYMQVRVPMAFGSDWPVVGADALGGIYAAVHRRARSHVESGEQYSKTFSAFRWFSLILVIVVTKLDWWWW